MKILEFHTFPLFFYLLHSFFSPFIPIFLLPAFFIALFFFLVLITYVIYVLISFFFSFQFHHLYCCTPGLSFFFLPFFPFYFLNFIFLVSSSLNLSCAPNSPITAGRNYAWKPIRHSLNNYPFMQLIDFPFQELCFLSPGSAFLSPS